MSILASLKNLIGKGAADVEAIREKIAAAKERRAEIVDAPRSRVEAEKTIDDAIASLAQHFNYTGLSATKPGETAGGMAYYLTDESKMAGPAAVIAALAPDALRDQLTAGFDQFYASTNTKPLSAAERAAALKAVDAELDALERQEEAAIVDLETAGVPIDRRPDMSVEAILGLDRKEAA